MMLTEVAKDLHGIADRLVAYQATLDTTYEFKVGDLVKSTTNHGGKGPKAGAVGVVRRNRDFGGSYTVEFADCQGHDGNMPDGHNCWYIGAVEGELVAANKKETK